MRAGVGSVEVMLADMCASDHSVAILSVLTRKPRARRQTDRQAGHGGRIGRGSTGEQHTPVMGLIAIVFVACSMKIV